MADKLDKGISARNTALKILTEVNQQGRYANISLKENLGSMVHTAEDSAFVTQLVYGTLEKQVTIDWVIKKFSNLKRVKPVIMNILRLGCYQILFMDRVPDSAACNESVNLCKLRGFTGLSGFVNAILRNIARNKENLLNFNNINSDTERLSLKYSYPLHLVKKWTEDYGLKTTEDILKGYNDDGYISVRVNSLKTTGKDLIFEFIKEGTDAKPGLYLPEALLIKGYGDIEGNIWYKKGYITVQGEGSMLVTHILKPREGDHILDACSSPGGKATHMAEYMNMRGSIFAWDIHPHRIELVNKNINRTGSNIIKTEVRDATVYYKEFKDTMDKVLIDAPCSGWGIINKKPDIKLRANTDLKDLLKIQLKILKACSSYVKPEGSLVYSTCTINKDENERMIDEFLKEKDEFVLYDFESDLPEALRPNYSLGMLQLIPSINRTDGFFIAKMQRKI